MLNIYIIFKVVGVFEVSNIVKDSILIVFLFFIMFSIGFCLIIMYLIMK